MIVLSTYIFEIPKKKKVYLTKVIEKFYCKKKMQSTEQQTDELASCLAGLSIKSKDGSAEKEKERDFGGDQVRSSHSTENFQGSTSLMRQRSLFTAGKVKFYQFLFCINRGFKIPTIFHVYRLNSTQEPLLLFQKLV